MQARGLLSRRSDSSGLRYTEQLTNGGSLRSDRPSTSLLISMRIPRSTGLLTSTSVWVCWPLWLIMRLSTKTGFFLSSFLSGLPDLTSFVVYVRLVRWSVGIGGTISRKSPQRSSQIKSKKQDVSMIALARNLYRERIGLTLRRIARCGLDLASLILPCPSHLPLHLSHSLAPVPWRLACRYQLRAHP